MTIQNPETEPDGQLLDRALPAIALPEASLADEREATRLAIRSADLLDTLTNLGRAIAEENEQLDALELITPGSWAAEEFHSRIISWLLNPSAHHRQAGTSSPPCSAPRRLRHGCSPRIGAPPRSSKSGRTSSTDSGATWTS